MATSEQHLVSQQQHILEQHVETPKQQFGQHMETPKQQFENLEQHLETDDYNAGKKRTHNDDAKEIKKKRKKYDYMTMIITTILRIHIRGRFK